DSTQTLTNQSISGSTNTVAHIPASALSGSVGAAQMPALTGDVTSSAGSTATTLASVVSAGTNTKITYDAKGRVTSGAQAQFSDLGGSVAATQMPALTGDVTSSAGSTATTLATSGVTAGTYTKITVDAKGRATTGATALFSDLSGSVAATQMPALTGDVTSSAGSTATTLATSGVTAGTYNKVTGDAKGRVTAGTALTSLTADVSGILPVANGGTGAATLTATGLVFGNGTSAAGSTA